MLPGSLLIPMDFQPIISESLKERILLMYDSEALALHLENGSADALYVLSNLVSMNFNAERMLYLAQKGDTKAIAQICKEYLEGSALLNELQRALFEQPLH